MDLTEKRALQELASNWAEVVTALEKLNPTAMVKPVTPDDIFRPMERTGDDSSLRFGIAPVVFKLPERSSGRAKNDLFVVVEGRLSLDRAQFHAEKKLVTTGFDSRAAYFRLQNDHLQHVYGTHYELEVDRCGHPFFHGQMRSFAELWERVAHFYQVPSQVVDQLQGVLRTVRVPIAQMDVFSVYLQLCADHLIGETSGPEERRAFEVLKNRMEFLQGAGLRSPLLSTDAARLCYRSWRWYPTPEN